MSGRSDIMLTAILATTCAASAQYVGTATHHFTFVEINAETSEPVPNPNGTIEPGEAALVSISISFTPAVGTVLHDPYPPLPSPVTVFALAHSFFQLELHSGSWRDWSLAPGWDAMGPSMNPAGNPVGSSIDRILAHQLVTGADTGNPIENIWQGICQPSSYTNRLQHFRTLQWGITPVGNSAVWLDYAGPPREYLFGRVQTNFAHMAIPIAIPAPGPSGLLIGGLAIYSLRRRRSMKQCCASR